MCPDHPGAPQRAHILFTAGVTPQSAEQFYTHAVALAAQGIQECDLLISSPGGNVMVGVTLYHVMRTLPIRFTTYNVGNVDSIALLPYLAGEERYALRGSTFMFHGVGFDINQPLRLDEKFLTERLDNIKADHQRLAAIIAGRAAFKSESEILQLYSAQAVKPAEWAKSVGIAHDIRDLALSPNTQVIRIGAAA